MRIKIKKILYYLTTSICIITLSLSIYLQTVHHKFNSDNVISQIEYLSSNQFEGRLTGSNGNEKAASLIENLFKQYNLSPLNNSYRETFTVKSPIRNNTDPQLTINNSSGIIKNYIYGIDFKEDMTNFRTPNISFSKNDITSISSKSFIINHNQKLFLFYVCLDKNFNFRSSFNFNSPYEFSVAITPELFNDILKELRNGNFININLPYTIGDCTTSNVIGVIHGIYPNLPPLVLCAHFDHLGTDCLGNYYSGALDNASGTCFLLELSKDLSSLLKPKRDIIFVAFTGEEFGLIGSEKFAYEYKDKIKNSKVINFDMIGARNTPITLMSGSRFSKDNIPELMNNMEIICKKNNLSYSKSFQDCSDHASFTNLDIDSLTICSSDLSKIHTPKDTVMQIDTNSIDDIYSVVIEEIYSDAFNNNLIILYKPYTIIIFLLLSVLLLLPYIVRKKF